MQSLKFAFTLALVPFTVHAAKTKLVQLDTVACATLIIVATESNPTPFEESREQVKQMLQDDGALPEPLKQAEKRLADGSFYYLERIGREEVGAFLNLWSDTYCEHQSRGVRFDIDNEFACYLRGTVRAPWLALPKQLHDFVFSPAIAVTTLLGYLDWKIGLPAAIAGVTVSIIVGRKLTAIGKRVATEKMTRPIIFVPNIANDLKTELSNSKEEPSMITLAVTIPGVTGLMLLDVPAAGEGKPRLRLLFANND